MRCTTGGDPACDALDGAMGPIRQLAMEDGGPLFAGTFNGDVLRCDPNQPTSCDAIGKVPGITAIAAQARGADDAQPSVYLGTTVGYEGSNGDIWRCPQQGANAKCRNVGRPVPGDFVASLAITDGSVFAGLGDGRVLRCTTGAPTSTCTTVAQPGGGITALSMYRNTLGVATDAGVVWTCPTGAEGTVTCTKVTSMPGAKATAVEIYGETVFAGFALDEPDSGGLSGAVMECDAGSACAPVVNFICLLLPMWDCLSGCASGGGRGSGVEDAEELALADDDVLDVLDLDLGAGVLAEHDGVALLHEHGHARAVVEHLARADGDDLALHRALLGALGKEDAAGGLRLGLEGLDEDAVFEGTNLGGGHFVFLRV
jgi:hypothetical protein